MNKDRQISAIAVACGWTSRFPSHTEGLMLPYHWYNINTKEKKVNLPDYLNDLNAMHKAEELLSADQWYTYNELLSMQLRPPQTIHTTAAQRAEAFLKAICKWEE